MKEFEGKKLLVLGGVKLACDIVKHAQSMGAYVAVLDYNVDSPAKEVADEGVLIDAMDVDAIVEYCQENHIDGVTTGFVDILMPVCYEVCKRLNLPYYATPKMLSMATNKIDFKDTCKEYGIPVPNTYLIGREITEDVYASINYPVFVKPLDASGSRGAGVCNNKEELDYQFADALSYSPTKNAIIEDYITGREFLLDYIAVDGEFRLLSVFDRYMCSDRGSAINYSNISMCPSRAIDNYLENINDRVINMFKALGFTNGLIFLQGHSNGDKITFYEMGCRLGGSFYNLEKKCVDLDPVDMTVRYALSGKMLNNINDVSESVAKFEKYAFVCNYLLVGDDETIAEIKGIEEIEKLPSYVTHIIQRGVGTHYRKDRTVDKPVICVYLAADSFEQGKKDIARMNEVFDVVNADGKSLLSEKFNPEEL